MPVREAGLPAGFLSIRHGVLPRILAVTLLLGGCAEARQWRDPAPESDTVSLEIQNRTGEPLRCVVVLAHFVTRNLEPVRPNGTARLELWRGGGQGALGFGQHKGEPMMVENILCGEAGRWQGTATDLPLTDIRAARTDRFLASCRPGDPRLVCTVSHVGT